MDMWQNPGRTELPETCWPPFVGSWVEKTGQARVVLRGNVDSTARERLREQLATLIDTGARFIAVDAHGVTRCDPGIIDLLGATQQRLHRRRGLLTLRGLHPCVLPAVKSGTHPGDTLRGLARANPAPEDIPEDDCSIPGAEQ
jgi:anti-anti-sigma regulatory factor